MTKIYKNKQFKCTELLNNRINAFVEFLKLSEDTDFSKKTREMWLQLMKKHKF